MYTKGSVTGIVKDVYQPNVKLCWIGTEEL